MAEQGVRMRHFQTKMMPARLRIGPARRRYKSLVSLTEAEASETEFPVDQASFIMGHREKAPRFF